MYFGYECVTNIYFQFVACQEPEWEQRCPLFLGLQE